MPEKYAAYRAGLSVSAQLNDFESEGLCCMLIWYHWWEKRSMILVASSTATTNKETNSHVSTYMSSGTLLSVLFVPSLYHPPLHFTTVCFPFIYSVLPIDRQLYPNRGYLVPHALQRQRPLGFAGFARQWLGSNWSGVLTEEEEKPWDPQMLGPS